jgi:hypothetical protein
MNTQPNDFVSREPREFHFKIGRSIASSLSGLIAGAIITSVLWLIGIWYVSQIQPLANRSASANVAPSAYAPVLQTHR